MKRISVSCDFDGTITVTDTVNALLQEFAEPAWLAIEDDWCAGKIGSRDCLSAQTDLLRIEPAQLDAYLDAVAVDPDAAAFFQDCERMGMDVVVVSDGYDWAVRRILDRIGAKTVPVFANRLVPKGADRWSLECPYMAEACGSGVCKCAVAAAPGLRAHIGDGRSDTCIADRVDVVFAKGYLLESRRARGAAATAFNTFADIRAALPALQARVVETVPEDAVAQRARPIACLGA